MKPGESEIDTLGRLLEASRKEIRTNEGDKRAILHGIIADETAKLPFVSEAERGALLKDAVVHIENATVKKWKGLPTLYIQKDTTVHVIEDDAEFPGYAALTKPKRKTIGDTVKCEGAFDVIVDGNIVSIAEERDKRTMVLDDGTGAVFLRIRDKEKAARISFGMQVKARGNVVESENGYVLIADEVRLSGEAVILNEMKRFLCKYT
ncbi:MAG TPA: hypothetical protein VMW67_01155 [Desulfobacteria bacterium]|nr:hypothetical protein [Desulfobacteria bacterium]